jgi:hypothetical protein
LGQNEPLMQLVVRDFRVRTGGQVVSSKPASSPRIQMH